MANIIYTYTDEAPMLATHSLLPIVKAFAGAADVTVETRDISLAGRILAAFADQLPAEQREADALAELGELAKTPEANIVKLPNISASVPQLKAAIAELQQLGYQLPDYPDDPANEAEQAVKARYDAVKGSAVNPVLREGNSDRRAPKAVKAYAQAHPHSMGEWHADSKTAVATMGQNDFLSNEVSHTFTEDDVLTVKHTAEDGTATVLREQIPVLAGEIFDATFISSQALDAFLREQISAAKANNQLFSVHLKATMMKVSDPIIFGHVVRAFFAETFNRFGEQLTQAGLTGENGLGAILTGIVGWENEAEITAQIAADLENGPALAMVNSDKGITNLHVPSDVIVDASMPAMIRNSGKMWDRNGDLQDTLAVIPDSSYAGVYQAVIDDCKEHGAYDPRTMGSVPNVGLMAKKAEEYGSHDKTFKIASPGTVEVVNSAGETVLSHEVGAGDIWRGCQTKDAAVRDWVKLAVTRARVSETPAVFWLDENRAHDRALIAKVREYLADHDTAGLEIEILAPAAAAKHAVTRIREGLDTISVTGNVLRDYNTDLFPILELGTSAKMLSVVPLLAGGGLFETGAGGSAPKHVEQLVQENHLRWDSLGEFMALAESLRQAGATVLADALENATAKFLAENKSPSRKAGELDNRGSHFWLARFWAEALRDQADSEQLAERFKPVADALAANSDAIERELLAGAGSAVDLGGYYRVDPAKADALMRPSATLNGIIDAI